MKQQVVSLGIVGKGSQFPFTGIFSAQQQLSLGKVSAVGRIHDADIKRDFRQTIQCSKHLNMLFQAHQGSIKKLFRSVWDWYHDSKPHSQIVSLTIQVLSPNGDLWMSMVGTSGVWGLSDDTWYPLLADGSAVLQDKYIAEYPMAVQVQPLPERIVVLPKPFQNVLPSSIGLNKRVLEVCDVR